jgi:hypothetical protein
MTIPIPELAAILDSHLFNGAIVHAALISGTLATNLAVTGDASLNEFTSATAHNLVTGSRIRFTVAAGGGNFIPGGLSNTTDYYVIRISATVFQIATTLANAIANTAIDFTSNGQGVLINEQLLTAADPLDVILNHEIPSGNGYTQRMEIEMGAAANAGAEARKNGDPVFVIPTGGSITYRHVAIIRNGVATIGDTGGNLADLTTEAGNTTIADGELKTFALQLFAQPA